MFGPFPSPFTESLVSPRSILELRLNALSAAIRNKPDWHTKRLDPEITAKWAQEASLQHITPTQFKFVIDELGYYDKLRNGSIEVADVDGVWKSPDLFPPDVSSDFTRFVDRLSNIPDTEKDWHPGSNDTVLNLVHPSLYLFVSGKTRTVSVDAEQRRLCVPTSLSELPALSSPEFTSAKYQWIPTPVAIDESGKATFASYINNLHPTHHRELYSTLATMFSQTLPVFEQLLSYLKSPRTPKIDLAGHQMYDESGEPEEESDDDYYNRYDTWYENRPLNPISIIEYVEPPPLPPAMLRDCRLQVIVKIQEIHLTPDSPAYNGGVWHVEGMENEQIVASAIYYYDCTNISESTLSFRQAVQEPDYEQNDNRGVEATFGLVDGEPLVQTLGSVVTKPGLVLAWPNVYQHRVSSFELIDKSKPGKRGILVFFLINPDTPMRYDTGNVPPQQRDWWLEEVQHDPTLTGKLPTEIRDLIIDWVDDPMPLDVAREHRRESMEERKYFRDNTNEIIYEREFSLCEH